MRQVEVLLLFLKIDTDCSYEEFVNTVILTNDTSCNGITEYACESGYRLTSGNLSRLCDIGQQWIGDPPVCSGKIIILIKQFVVNIIFALTKIQPICTVVVDNRRN